MRLFGFAGVAIAVASLLLLSLPAAAKGPGTKYPKNEVEGRVLMTCTVMVTGGLRDCAIGYENLPGLGFGEAALKLSAELKMRPATRDGVPFESLVNIPLIFPPRDAPPKTQAERDRSRIETLVAARQCETARGIAQSIGAPELEQLAAGCVE